MVLIPLAVEIAKPFIDGNSIGSSSSTQSMASMAKCVNYHTAIPSYDYDHVSTLNLAVSERCDHTSLLFRPLLITGTPRSATIYTSKKLQSLGMRLTLGKIYCDFAIINKYRLQHIELLQ